MSKAAELSQRILAKTSEYLDFPSVVGHETPFLDHLARDFSALGFKPQRVRNLCIVETGRPGPVHIAHIDRHGGVVSGKDEIVYAAHAVRNIKYGDMPEAGERFAERVRARYTGEEIFAYDRATGGRIAYGVIEDIVLEDGQLKLVAGGMIALEPGTPVNFARRLDRSQNSYIVGQLDNPVSAAVLRVATERGLNGTIVFTAEEEIGRSAEHFIGWAKDALGPRRDLLVLDTTPFEDSAITLAGAVVMRRRDATASFDPQMTERVEGAARRALAPIVFKCDYVAAENQARAARGLAELGLGLTELGKIAALSDGDFTGTTLQVPTFNYHSNQESTTPKALAAFAQTLLEMSHSVERS